MAAFHVRLSPAAREEIRNAGERGPRLLDAIERGMGLGGIEIVGEIQRTKLSGKPLKVRSGALRGDVQSRAERRGMRISAFIGVPADSPAAAYAEKLETGGVIKAKPGKALAIPLDAALTPSGMPKFPGGPTTVPDLFLLPRKEEGKPPLLVQPKGEDDFVPLFVLKKSVEMPRTQWLSAGIAENLERFVEAINDEIAKVP